MPDTRGEYFPAGPDPEFHPGNPPDGKPMTTEDELLSALFYARSELEDFTVTRHPESLMARVKCCEQAARASLMLEEFDGLLELWKQRGLTSKDVILARRLTLNLLKAQLAVWEGE